MWALQHVTEVPVSFEKLSRRLYYPRYELGCPAAPLPLAFFSLVVVLPEAPCKIFMLVKSGMLLATRTLSSCQLSSIQPYHPKPT